MKGGTKILLIGGGILTLGSILAYKYKRAAENLKMNFAGFIPTGFENGKLKFMVRVNVLNASRFAFPVPKADVNFYVKGNYVGTAKVLQWQKIGARGNYFIDLHGSMSIEQSLLSLSTMAANQALPNEVVYSGAIYFGKYAMPFNSSYAVSGYRGGKWRPSKSQAREFAQKMANDSDFADAYNKRKEEKAAKKRASSSFDYSTAGGYYVPTKEQHDFVWGNLNLFSTPEEQEAANMVMSGYSTREKVHHDFIHIVNEKRRSFLD